MRKITAVRMIEKERPDALQRPQGGWAIIIGWATTAVRMRKSVLMFCSTEAAEQRKSVLIQRKGESWAIRAVSVGHLDAVQRERERERERERAHPTRSPRGKGDARDARVTEGKREKRETREVWKESEEGEGSID
jgi:hypothetical protein